MYSYDKIKSTIHIYITRLKYNLNVADILVNGLLRHHGVNPNRQQKHLLIRIAKCAIYHNRDKNAVQNMISIVEELKKTGKRPLRFTRKIVEAN